MHAYACMLVVGLGGLSRKRGVRVGVRERERVKVEGGSEG